MSNNRFKKVKAQDHFESRAFVDGDASLFKILFNLVLLYLFRKTEEYNDFRDTIKSLRSVEIMQNLPFFHGTRIIMHIVVKTIDVMDKSGYHVFFIEHPGNEDEFNVEDQENEEGFNVECQRIDHDEFQRLSRHLIMFSLWN